MEDGSLVQEALHRMQQFRQNGGDSVGGWLQNTLVIDVYYLPESKDKKSVNGILSNQEERRDLLLSLAQLGKRLNEYFQHNVRRWYHWHSGGEGPVFGVHVATSDNTHNSNNNGSKYADLPHLRATCRYGENIQDEWFAIAIMLQISKTVSKNNIVVECWDVDDGQVLLIEAAEVLPSWVDEYGPDFCRHVCWIQSGKVVLLQPHHSQDTQTTPPPPLTRKEALDIFMQPDQHDCIIATDKIQMAIQNRVRCFGEAFQQNHDNSASPLIGLSSGEIRFCKSNLHRAAFVVPYAVACLMKERPDLVQCAVLAYCHGNYNEASSTTSSTKNTSPLPDDMISLDFEDLVWTTHTLSRTSYAMLRTIEHEEQIKQKGKLRYKSIEVNRMKRLCRVEATPHLKYALRNGMCLTAGFKQILESTPLNNVQENDEVNIARNQSVGETRILYYWTRIDKESGGNGQWLVDSWMAGPNEASYNLNNMRYCPVYNPEVVGLTSGNGGHHICPLSHARQTLRNQIQSVVKRAQNISSDSKSSNCFCREFFEKPPLSQDADDESWLQLESLEAMDKVMEESSKTTSFIPKKKNSYKSEQNAPAPLKDPATAEQVKHESAESSTDHQEAKSLGSMLDNFQTFVNTKSDIEGVQIQNEDEETSASPDDESVQVNPRVFLNLLHTTLKSSPKELQDTLKQEPPAQKGDPYFSKEDYDLMQEDDSSASSEDEKYYELDGDNFSMRAVMDAMDNEIRDTNVAMEMDSPDNEGAPSIPDDDIKQDAHILSNLLESLDAGSGHAGPVRNILKGMGEEAP